MAKEVGEKEKNPLLLTTGEPYFSIFHKFKRLF